MIHRFHVHAVNLSVCLDTGSGNHRRLLNVSELAESLGEEYCATLLGFCVFCGEYCTKQYLQEKGKVGPLRMMDNNPNCVQAIWRRMEHPTRSSPPGIGWSGSLSSLSVCSKTAHPVGEPLRCPVRLGQRSNVGETMSVRRWAGMGEYTRMIVGTGVVV